MKWPVPAGMGAMATDSRQVTNSHRAIGVLVPWDCRIVHVIETH